MNFKGVMIHMSKTRFLTILLPVLILLCSALLVAGNQGTIKWTFDHPVQIGGKQINAGTYLLRWKQDNSSAQISVELRGKPVAEAHAKVTERTEKSDSDAINIAKDAQGADAVKEIRLGGKKTVFILE
jgi:hypothetical protein